MKTKFRSDDSSTGEHLVPVEVSTLHLSSSRLKDLIPRPPVQHAHVLIANYVTWKNKLGVMAQSHCTEPTLKEHQRIPTKQIILKTVLTWASMRTVFLLFSKFRENYKSKPKCNYILFFLGGLNHVETL